MIVISITLWFCLRKVKRQRRNSEESTRIGTHAPSSQRPDTAEVDAKKTSELSGKEHRSELHGKEHRSELHGNDHRSELRGEEHRSTLHGNPKSYEKETREIYEMEHRA